MLLLCFDSGCLRQTFFYNNISTSIKKLRQFLSSYNEQWFKFYHECFFPEQSSYSKNNTETVFPFECFEWLSETEFLL